MTGVAYVGATAPRLGIFVVDASGPPRAMVGPVAHAYEVFGPLAARYTDETARTLARRDKPWAAAYAIAAPAPPSSLQLRWDAEARAARAEFGSRPRPGDNQGARSSPRRDRDPARDRQARRDPGRDQGQAHRRGLRRAERLPRLRGRRRQWRRSTPSGARPRRLRPINSRVYGCLQRRRNWRRAPRLLSKLFQN